jgi:predicted transcriptional regulator
MKGTNKENAENNEQRIRDQMILNRLARIEHKVDSIDQTGAFALRAEAEKHFASVKKIFKNGKRRAQVYLAANGMRTVQQIASHLKMKRQNVGPELKVLHSEYLLEVIDVDGVQGDVWSKKTLDHSLRISQFLCSEYSLGEDGRPLSPAARR